MRNPYVFVVGCPRSGTTLLQRMINGHPQIALMSEAPWILECFEQRTGLTPDGLVTADLIAHLLSHPRFERLRIGREALRGLLPDGEPVAYSAFVGGIFDLYASRKHKALVGNKTPAYVRKLDLLHALWPAARLVHIIRDGRDVCLSVANWPKASQADKPGSYATWNEHPVATTALWWRLNVQLGRRIGLSLAPECYHEVRYESLVDHPREECESLCAFLGLEFDEAMLHFQEGRTRSDPALSAKRAWLPLTPGLRDWKSQMSIEDLGQFEAAAGDLLDELGYPRAVARQHPEQLERAARVRELLVREMRWSSSAGQRG